MEFFQNAYNWIIQPTKIQWYIGDSELPQMSSNNFKPSPLFSCSKIVKDTPHNYIQQDNYNFKHK